MALPSTSTQNRRHKLMSNLNLEGHYCERFDLSPKVVVPRNGNGFTLIEILITIGIFAVIATIGLIISLDFYRSYAFRSEESTIVSILQKARSQSMDNIDQVRHGVHFQADPLKYILFECASGTPQCSDYSGADTSRDLVIDPAYGSTVSGVPFDVVFS